ncbi:hypothetical protein P1X15_01575 [Runella sp. MFBS21]|uniref:hypothetical protein n=1 Tax=Runella sp. MFBS21 TaxID=3034018 RepID=UPI0023F9E67D|nr:hypothetical protein [Runella sp. MFBS21]MDF7816255.1 hypothetical protein [Runella sp. MFBS21]
MSAIVYKSTVLRRKELIEIDAFWGNTNSKYFSIDLDSLWAGLAPFKSKLEITVRNISSPLLTTFSHNFVVPQPTVPVMFSHSIINKPFIHTLKSLKKNRSVSSIPFGSEIKYQVSKVILDELYNRHKGQEKDAILGLRATLCTDANTKIYMLFTFYRYNNQNIVVDTTITQDSDYPHPSGGGGNPTTGVKIPAN